MLAMTSSMPERGGTQSMTRGFTSHGVSIPRSRMYATRRRSVCSARIRNASSRSDARTSGRNARARARAASLAGTISPRRRRSSRSDGVMSTISSSVTSSRKASSTTCSGRGPSIAPMPSTVLRRSVRCRVAISIIPARSKRGTASVIGRPCVSTPARSSRHATSGLRRSSASTSTVPSRAGEVGPPSISRSPSASSQRLRPSVFTAATTTSVPRWLRRFASSSIATVVPQPRAYPR